MHIPVMADEFRAEQTVVESDSVKNNQIFETIGEQVEQLALDENPLPAGFEGRAVPTEVIESLCMNCGKDVCSRPAFMNFKYFFLMMFFCQGTTTLLLTKIPYFDDEILMSFKCPHCQYENCDVQSARQIQETGVEFILLIDSSKDLHRAIKVSDTSKIWIEEFDIQKSPAVGQVSNVEGILRMIPEDLHRIQATQEEDGEFGSEGSAKIESLISNVNRLLAGEITVNFYLTDPAGNAWLERLPTDTDSKFTSERFERSRDQNESLGIDMSQDPESDEDLGGIKNEYVYYLPFECPNCLKPAEINYHSMDIPHFKEVVISAINCSHCDYRSNDVNTGGAVPEKGKRISLTVSQPEDLNRDILKSQTCVVNIPECQVNMGAGTLGARFTTVEGLLTQVRDDLRNSQSWVGEDEAEGADSIDPEDKAHWNRLFHRLDKAIKGDMDFTLILEDPLAHSYVQSLNPPDPDPQMQIEEYERTEEENEDLGLADMKTRLDADGNYVAE